MSRELNLPAREFFREFFFFFFAFRSFSFLYFRNRRRRQHTPRKSYRIYLFILYLVAYVFGIFTFCQHVSQSLTFHVRFRTTHKKIRRKFVFAQLNRVELGMMQTDISRYTIRLDLFNIRFDLVSFLLQLHHWFVGHQIFLDATLKTQFYGTLPFCFCFVSFRFFVYKINVRASGTEITFDSKILLFLSLACSHCVAEHLIFVFSNCLTERNPDINSKLRGTFLRFIYFSVI